MSVVTLSASYHLVIDSTAFPLNACVELIALAQAARRDWPA